MYEDYTKSYRLYIIDSFSFFIFTGIIGIYNCPYYNIYIMLFIYIIITIYVLKYIIKVKSKNLLDILPFILLYLATLVTIYNFHELTYNS
jgi:hypothetical protein